MLKLPQMVLSRLYTVGSLVNAADGFHFSLKNRLADVKLMVWDHNRTFMVERASVMTDRDTGRSRGFGFVEMPTQSQAQTAIKSLNGKELLGKQMNVNEARARSDQGRTGGGRMDYSGGRNRY